MTAVGRAANDQTVRGPRGERGRAGWWLLTAAYAAGVFAASSVPGGNFDAPYGSDKVVHAAEFAGLAYLAARATGSPLTGFLVAAVWGAVDEVHQSFVPLRTATMGDWLADLAGGAAAAVWCARAARRR